MRGNLAGIGIVKGQSFKPDAHARQLLDDAAKTASRYSHTLAYMGAPVYYPDRNWLNPFPASNASFLTDSYQDLNMRAAFFTYAYSASPGMAVNMRGVGAKYPNAFKDADGKFLSGTNNYKLHLPAHIPARLF